MEGVKRGILTSTAVCACIGGREDHCQARGILRRGDLSCPDMRLHAWIAPGVMVSWEPTHCYDEVAPRLHERRHERPGYDLSVTPRIREEE